MADRVIKPDSGNDLVLQNNGGSKKIEITDSGNIEVTGAVDLQANELILDADGDTSITADTDDQIDLKVGGSDQVSITTSVVDINGNELILDADGDTSITADTDDQIDFKTGGSDRVTIDSTGNVEFSGNGTGTDDSAKFTKGSGTTYFTIGGTAVTSEYKLRFANHNGIVGGIKTLTNSTIFEVNKSGSSGGGIDFSGAGTSTKILNDYETGSWSPTITAQSGSGGTWTFSDGTYTKIGRFVICSGKIKTTAVGSSGGGLYLTLPLNGTSWIFLCSLWRNF